MRVVFFVLSVLASLTINAQTDTSVFTKQVTVETSDYIFLVPALWKNIPEIDNSSKNRKFELTGVSLPTEYNYFPVLATCTLRKYECKDIHAAEDYVTTEMTIYPDRVTQAGQNYKTDTLHILSGEKATLYSSRFLRHSKNSNYSRFDLIAYSTKRKAAYIFCITFQYKDPTYAFETKYKLKEYAMKFFSGISLQ